MSEIRPDLLVETLGTTTRAWEYGDREGETIVLVHGFRGDHHGLEGIARELTRRMPGLRAVVPDLPGFGETPPVPGHAHVDVGTPPGSREHSLDLYGEWLIAFVNGVAARGHAILGHSFGSLVVANALSQGLDPSATILVNPIAAPALDGPQAALTKLAIGYYRAADLLPEQLARGLLGNPLIVRGMSEVMAKTGDPGLRRWIHGQHDRYFSRFAGSQTLLQAFRASVSHTVPEYASALTQPTLLIAGDRDDITPVSKQLMLHRRLADSRLRILPGVGHLVHYEAVDDAAAEITGFLTEVAGSGRRGSRRRNAGQQP